MEHLFQDSDQPGLCASCRHVRTIRSDRGSVFYLCRRSLTDPGYPQYPRLPVLFCRGYEAADSNAGVKTKRRRKSVSADWRLESLRENHCCHCGCAANRKELLRNFLYRRSVRDLWEDRPSSTGAKG